MASCCARGSLDQILGKMFSGKVLSSFRAGGATISGGIYKFCRGGTWGQGLVVILVVVLEEVLGSTILEGFSMILWYCCSQSCWCRIILSSYLGTWVWDLWGYGDSVIFYFLTGAFSMQPPRGCEVSMEFTFKTRQVHSTPHEMVFLTDISTAAGIIFKP